MIKPTLLQLTQSILTSMESDEVNSISDTTEATDVASTIVQTYYDIITEHDLPVNNSLINLESLGDVTKPTHLHMPDNISLLEWIKYDTRATEDAAIAYTSMIYAKPEAFIEIVNGRSSIDANNLVVYDSADVPLIISTISPPTFWTSFDDEYIVFDAYNVAVDSTIQASKTLCYGSLNPEFLLEDDAVPNLPENLFSYLLARSRAMCFSLFKQDVNQKVEQQENRFRLRIQRNKWRESRMLIDTSNFGRK